MNPSHVTPINNIHALATPSARSTPDKRQSSTDDGRPTKKLKPTVEVPQVYSDAVRRKLAATSRTGQACDRCKERKMKCDTDPMACQPCRQKNLRCYTTDRVTGQSRERGQNNRVENELQFLREQNAAYERKYGALQPDDLQSIPPAEDTQRLQHLPMDRTSRSTVAPSSQYIGWPATENADPLQYGPVNGTEVDILDGVIDIAGFECDMMEEYQPSQLGRFNVSRTSITNTTTGYQTVTDPRLPFKEEAIRTASTYLTIMNQYAPVLHRPSFMKTVDRIYDESENASLAERCQLAMVLSIVAFQTATRNHNEAASKFEQSHYWLHYALTWYRELIRERSIASMQALALVLIHFRNTPKPGYSWSFGHNLIMKAIELDYHRDPDKITLPLSENNPLAKELRKRVFHAILGICVTTGCRVSKPAPWQLQHIDVPLPTIVMDADLNESRIEQKLGRCDFWPCLQLAKLLPLLIEMYNFVTVVRRPEVEYVQTVEILHAKIDAWRRDWDKTIEGDEPHANLKVATLFMESWAAEYMLNLYHPSLCPTRSSEVMERHLDICHKQAQRLLRSFHILSQRYKGVDFTWHSTAAYAMGFGVTLHIYGRRIGKVSNEQFDIMRNEFKGWLSLMAYADLVMRTGNHLQHIFEPRVRRLENEYLELLHPSLTDVTVHQQQKQTQHLSNGSFNRPFAENGLETAAGLQSTVPGGSTKSTSRPPDHATLYEPRQQSNHEWQLAYLSAAPAPSFPPFGTHGGQYPLSSTSVTPLLSDHVSGFLGYSSNAAIPSEAMMFTPAHYTDPNTMWPMITVFSHDQDLGHNKE